MATSYFKATNGKITVFRASATRDYRSAKFDRMISFSAAPAASDAMPAVKITKEEYGALQQAKMVRLRKGGQDPAHYTSPQHSWVHNMDIGA